jgi:hypothetical protein
MPIDAAVEKTLAGVQSHHHGLKRMGRTGARFVVAE